MYHPIYKIISVQVTGRYEVRVRFDDGTEKTIDLEPVLRGEMYGKLRDEVLFQKVEVDPEVHTIQWPSGADFDPALLYHWEKHVEEVSRRAQEWEPA